MEIKSWNRAVTIEFGGERHIVKRIDNTKQAAICLLREWPRKKGYYYHRAIRGCTMALKGKLADEDARFYLIDAAADAHLRYTVSIGPAVLDKFDSEIAAVCDELVFEISADNFQPEA
jgi:hypothetical protein